MPQFTVCAKSQVKAATKRFKATHLISTIDPGDRIFKPPRISGTNHLYVWFDDEENDSKPNAPTMQHAETLLEFGKNLPDDARVVVHCFAGACRSTATALALWLQANGTDRLDEGVLWLREDRPIAAPNLLLARHFDHLLGMNGKFVTTCDQIGLNTEVRWWKTQNL